jgi:hypothetical protein
MRLYDGDTFDHKGREYIFRAEHDSDAGTPWEREDGHGPVSDWTNREKAPGERLLHSDRHAKRYYDFAEACKIARRDGWGLGEVELAKLEKQLGRKPKKGEIIAASVEADFDYLRRWCTDQWEYICISVEHVESGRKEYLGGVDSDSPERCRMRARAGGRNCL